MNKSDIIKLSDYNMYLGLWLLN